jgi:hypothetical protein
VAVSVAVRADEYGTWALTAAAPLACAAVIAWPATAVAAPADSARADRKTLACALIALACIVCRSRSLHATENAAATARIR